MEEKSYVKRSFVSVIGIVIITLGVGFAKTSDFGVDPYTSAVMGLSKLCGIDMGTLMLLMNIIIILISWRLLPKIMGFGTIFNMLFIGYLIEFMSNTLHHLFDSPSMLLKILFLIIGTLIFSFGVSLYIQANVGVGPYDAMTLVIVDKSHASYRTIRVVQDVFFVIVGIVTGGPFGVGTIVLALFTGPIVDVMNRYLTTKII